MGETDTLRETTEPRLGRYAYVIHRQGERWRASTWRNRWEVLEGPMPLDEAIRKARQLDPVPERTPNHRQYLPMLSAQLLRPGENVNPQHAQRRAITPARVTRGPRHAAGGGRRVFRGEGGEG